VATGTATHALDITPRFRGRAAIAVDGRQVAVSPAPSPRRPWVETALALDGSRVTVVLGGRPPWLETDVFVDGASLLDGRTLEEARAGAPPSISRFEDWTGGPISGISTTRLRSPPVIAVAIASFALMAIGLLVFQRGAIAASLAGLGMVGWGLLVAWTYVVGIGRARAWLIPRSNVSDVVRFGILGLVVTVGWFATLALFVVPVLVLSLFRQ
jgi:hypothetical protein